MRLAVSVRRPGLASSGRGMIGLQLAVEGGLADAQEPGGGQFVAGGFTQGPHDGAALEFFEGNDFVDIGNSFAGSVLQVGG